MISIGQYGMTSSVYRCGLVQCMYEFIVCMYYGYECSFIYHVYRGYSPFMYCISVCMVFICMYMYIIHMYYTYVCGLVQCVCVFVYVCGLVQCVCVCVCVCVWNAKCDKRRAVRE